MVDHLWRNKRRFTDVYQNGFDENGVTYAQTHTRENTLWITMAPMTTIPNKNETWRACVDGCFRNWEEGGWLKLAPLARTLKLCRPTRHTLPNTSTNPLLAELDEGCPRIAFRWNLHLLQSLARRTSRTIMGQCRRSTSRPAEIKLLL